MNASENKRALTVGLFVLLGIVIFVTGVLVLGGKQNKFTRNIRLNALFSNVGGLKVGNNVWFSGVKIGTVRRIYFVNNSQVEVEMNIQQSAQEFIRSDAQASIGSEGFIGNRLVVIAGGSPQAPMVEDGARLKTAAALSTDEIMETLQANNRNLLKVTTDFKAIVDKVSRGKGTIGAALTDEAAERDFRAILANLNATTANAAKASGSLTAFTSKLNTRGSLAHELVSDTTVFRTLKSSVAKLQQTASSATEIANRAKVTTDNLAGASENVKRATAKLNSGDNALGVLLNDAGLARDLKTTMTNLGGSSKKLDETLDAAQHNFLLRGYFKKKAKREEKAREDSLKRVAEGQ
jgi:phospholipid/cholesterol/gamma-HCH transport system substrate-binding protein